MSYKYLQIGTDKMNKMNPPKTRMLCSLAVCFLALIGIQDAAAQVTPPDPIIVDCIDDVPPPLTLNWTDACAGSGSVTSTDAALNGGTCGGTITRTWQYTDNCGDFHSVSQTITVSDNIPPVFPIFNVTIGVACETDIPPPAPLAWTDNCDGTGTVMPTDGAPIGDFPCNYTFIRTWSYTDVCGNSASTSQLYRVRDNISPLFDPRPSDVTVHCSAAIPPMTDLGWTDNCDGTGIVTGVDISDGNTNPEIITRTWTVTDACGNPAITSQVITVTNATGGISVSATENSGVTPNDGVICSGDNAVLEAAPGFAGYNWSGGLVAGETTTVTTAGTYTVTVTDADGCEDTGSFTVNVSSLPVPGLPNLTVCQDEAVAYDLTQHNSSVGAGFVVWYDGDPSAGGAPFLDATSADISAPTDLWVGLTDPTTNCTGFDNVNLTLNVNPTAVISGNTSFCQGSSTVLQASGGANLSYEWSNVSNSSSQGITVATPGDYTVTITDNLTQCTAEATVTVTELSLPGVSAVADLPTACEGDVVTYTLTGTPGATVTYFDNVAVSTVTLDGLTGEAVVTAIAGATDFDFEIQSITDGICSQNYAANVNIVSITVNAPPNAGTDGVAEVCSIGAANLTVDLSASLGGTPDVGGVWTDDNGTGVDLTDPTSVDFTGVVPNTYGFTYTVSGLAPCPFESSAVVAVTVHGASPIMVDSTVCNAALTAYTAFVTFASGTVVSDVGVVNNLGTGQFTINNIPAGTIATITGTDAVTGCESIIIAQDDCPCPVLTEPVIVSASDVCDGVPAPQLSVTVGGGLTVNWYDVAVGGTPIVSNTANFIPPAATLGTNTYYAETLDPFSDCVSATRTQVSFTVNANPEAEDATIGVCDDNSDGITVFTLADADATVLNGQVGMSVTYHELSGQAINGTEALGATYQNVTPNTQNIFARVEDANGCFALSTITLDALAAPSLTTSIIDTTGLVDNDGTICTGEAITLGVNETGLTYVWSTTETTQSVVVTPLSSETFTVTVTDDNGCTASQEMTITVNGLPSATLVTTEMTGASSGDGIICIGDNVTLTVQEVGVDYSWSNNQSSQTIIESPTSNTTYTVTVTDANGCTVSASDDITVNPLPVPMITVTESSGVAMNDSLFCTGDIVMLDAGVFDTYTWSFNNETSPSITVGAGGDYTVTVTDANNCIAEDTVTITENPLPVPTITATDMSGVVSDGSIFCSGDTLILDAGVFSEYSWNFNSESGQTIQVTEAGTYIVFVTDANDCEASAEFTITESPLPTSSITLTETSGTSGSDATICAGDSVTLTVADVGFDYLWSNDNENTQSIVVNPTETTTYTVTITDTNGCQNELTQTVLVNPLPEPTIGVSETSGIGISDSTFCAGDEVSLEAGIFVFYDWDSGENTPIITVTTGGEHAVTVTDANGCLAADTVTLIENALPVSVITVTDTSGVIDDDGVICTGDTATLDAGIFESYAWSDGLTTSQTFQATAGEYTVTVTDENNCENTASFIIMEIPLPTATIVVSETSGAAPDDAVICLGDEVSLAVAEGGLGYEWSDVGQVSQGIIVAPLETTTYSVSVTGDFDGCVSVVEQEIIVNSLPEPMISVTETSGVAANDSIFCTGDEVILDAGVFASYLWDSGENTPTITVSTGGDHAVTVTDGNGCEAADTVTLVENALPAPVITATDMSGISIGDGTVCSGDSAILDAGLFESYLWSDGVTTTQTFQVAAGEYTVTVTDANGCDGTASFTIVETLPPSGTVQITETSGLADDDGVICMGDTLTLTILGTDLTYEWEDAGQMTPSITVVPTMATTTYTVTITDTNSGCTTTVEQLIFATPLPEPMISVTDTFGIADNDNIFCLGDMVTLEAGVFDAYQWDGNGTSPTITVMEGGDYAVTVTDIGGCSAADTITLVSNALPDPTISAIDTSGSLNDGIICTGDTILLETQVFTSYLWSDDDMTTGPTLNAAAGGDYTVTVTDENGCENSATYTLTESPLPVGTVTVVENSGFAPDDAVICAGDEVTITVPEMGLGYEWSEGAQLTQSIIVNPMETTTYTVTITNDNGCSSEMNQTIVVTPLPNPTIIVSENSGSTVNDSIFCEGTTVTLSATGAFTTYTWLPSGETSPTITVTQGGDYILEVTDVNGCIGTDTVTITENPQPTTTITVTENSGSVSGDNIICEGDTVVLDAGPGFDSYVWSDDDGTTTQTLVVTTGGDYTVTFTDSNGCDNTATVTITSNPIPVPNITATDMSGSVDNDGVFCSNDTVILDAGVFPSYNWLPNGQNTQTIQVTEGGQYIVQVADAGGCIGMDTFEVFENVLPSMGIEITENSGIAPNDGILCDGGQAFLNAGVGYQSYQWSDAANTTGPSLVVTETGDYIVTVTDANSCEIIDTVTVVVNPLPTLVITETDNSGLVPNDDVFCEGDVAVLEASPGYEAYQWSDEDNTQSPTLDITIGGIYTVTVTDANGCEATAERPVFSTPLPEPMITATDVSGNIYNDGIVCAGDTVLLDAGVFSSYNWLPNVETTSSISVTASGTYAVEVTGSGGCTASTSFDVVVNPTPTPTIATFETSGNISNDGIICDGDFATLDPGEYAGYEWSLDGGVQRTLIVDSTGTYTVTITDDNGCTATDDVNVIVNPLPEPTITISENSGVTSDDGIICLGDEALLDAGPYAGYEWSTGELTQSINATTTGVYTVTVTDANGCLATHSVNLTVLNSPIVSNPNISVCLVDASSYDLTQHDAEVGLGAVTWYEGDPDAGGIVIPNPASYDMTNNPDIWISMNDMATGCSVTLDVSSQPTVAPDANIEGALDLCVNSFTTLSAPDTAGYMYLWEHGPNSSEVIILNPGDYTVTVTSADGCTTSNTVTVIENPLPTPTITGADSLFCEGTSIVMSADAGYAAYAWSNDSITQGIVVVDGGTYTVTVTDLNGCSGTTDFSVFETPNPTPVITGDNLICEGLSTTIDAGANYDSYLWNDGSSSQTLEVSEAGAYTVSVVDTFGCQGSGQFTLTVEDSMELVIEEPDSFTCDVDTVRLTAMVENDIVLETYSWGTTDGFIAYGADSSTVTTAQAGTYIVTAISAEGCVATEQVVVMDTPSTLMEINDTLYHPVCYGDSTGVIQIDSVLGGVGPYLYQVDTSAFSAQNVYAGLPAGQYTITAMDANGCEYSETVEITQPPLVTLELIPDSTTIDLGDSIRLQAFVNPNIELGDTIWSPAQWMSCTDCMEPWVAPLETTLYSLTVADTNGCDTTAYALVRIRNLDRVFIPNSFTPNNDGANDIFMIFGGTGVERVRTFKVFDRWGELLWEADNFQPNDPRYGWNGRYRSAKMNPGIFVYFAEIEYTDGTTKIHKGDVTLIGTE